MPDGLDTGDAAADAAVPAGTEAPAPAATEPVPADVRGRPGRPRPGRRGG